MNWRLIKNFSYLILLGGLQNFSPPIEAETSSISYFIGAPKNLFNNDLLAYENFGEESFVEQWQLLSRLDNGGLLSVFFGVHNAGFGDEHVVIVLKYVDPHGNSIVDSILGKEINTTLEPFSLEVDKHFLRKTTDGYRIFVQGEKLAVEGVITPQSLAYRAGDGRIKRNEEHAHITISSVLPRGRLEGELQVSEESRAITGYVYIDHSEAVLPAYEFSQSWRSLRVHHDGFSINFLSIELLPEFNNERINLLHLVTPEGLSRATLNCNFDSEPGLSPSSAWSVRCADIDFGVNIKVEPLQIVYRTSSLEQLGPFEQFVAKMVIPEPIGFTIHHRHQITVHAPGLSIDESAHGYSEMLFFNEQHH